MQASLQGTSGGKPHAEELPSKGIAAETPPTVPDNKAFNEAADPAVELPWAGGSTRTSGGGVETDESSAYEKLDIGSKQSPWF